MISSALTLIKSSLLLLKIMIEEAAHFMMGIAEQTVVFLKYLITCSFFWWSFGVIFVVILMVLFSAHLENKKKHLLSWIIDKKIREEQRRLPLFTTVKASFVEAYFPSISSFVVVMACIVVLACIGGLIGGLFKLAAIYFPLLSVGAVMKAMNPSDLIAIHAGVGTLIFALIIFIAEYLKNDRIDARVLLRESYLYPVTVAEISVFIIFFFVKNQTINMLLVIAVAIAAIISLSGLIRVLLNPFQFYEKRSLLLKERLKKSTELAVKERVGKNSFLQEINEGKIKLEYRLFPLDRASGFHKIVASKPGVITDIDLGKLKEAADFLDRHAEKNGYSWASEVKKNDMGEIASFEVDVKQEQVKKNLKENRERYIKVIYQDAISEEHNCLMAFDKKLIAGDDSEEALKRITKITLDAFKVKPTENFSDQVRIELSQIRDQAIDAVSQNRTGTIETYLNLYRGMSEAFLEYLEKVGVVYDAEAARQERGAIFDHWDEIRWLKDDVKSIFFEGLKVKDFDVIRKIAFLPVSIAIRAIKFFNQLVFQEFTSFAVVMYLAAHRLEDKQIRAFLIGRVAQYLHEISSIHIEPEIKRGEVDAQRMQSLTDSIVYIIKVYQDLMKIAYDEHDEVAFEEFRVSVVSKLCKYFKAKDEYQRNAESEDCRKAKLKIQQAKQKMIFGFGAWLLSAYKKDASRKAYYEKMSGCIDLDLEVLTSIFQDLKKSKTQDFWGWSWWNKSAEDGAYFDNTDHLISAFYCAQMLKALSRGRLEGFALPVSREFSECAKAGGELQSILASFENSGEEWQAILNATDMNQIAVFRQLLNDCHAAYMDRENKIIHERPLDKSKIEEFKKEVLMGYSSHPGLRSILDYCKLVKKLENQAISDSSRFGVNIIDDKEAFFEDWHVSYHQLGVNYGERIAEGENANIIADLVSNCKERSLDEFCGYIEKSKNENDLIILSSHTALSALSEHGEFRPGWHKDSKGRIDVESFAGWFVIENKKVPIFTVLRKKPFDLLLINKCQLGDLIFYSPSNGEEEKPWGQFYIEIKAFSHDKQFLEDFLKTPPAWLQKEGDQEKQRAYLLGKVRLQVLEKFRFYINKNFEGYKVKSKEEG